MLACFFKGLGVDARLHDYNTSKRSQDMDAAKRLFDLSEEICGVRMDGVL